MIMKFYPTALSLDGSVLAIGADENDENGTNAGHVRVFQSKTLGTIGGDIYGRFFGSKGEYLKIGSII